MLFIVLCIKQHVMYVCKKLVTWAPELVLLIVDANAARSFQMSEISH